MVECTNGRQTSGSGKEIYKKEGFLYLQIDICFKYNDYKDHTFMVLKEIFPLL